MKRKAHLLLTLLILNITTYSQDDWVITNLASTSRIDDIYFLNDSIGWAAGGYNGKIFHTRNGGETWHTQYTAGKYLRSIEFATPLIGFCGSLDSAFYKTTDGGVTWTNIASSIQPKPPGVCGISAPDPLHIYGVGIWNAPAFFIKSIDGGNTWISTDMTPYATKLVDILFLNKDTGYISGTANPASDGGIVLYTTNGGNTWTVKMKTMAAEDYIWKIQTPDSIHFFGSVQSLPGNKNCRIISSSNKGATWEVIKIKNTYFNTEMIGFIDKDTGWVGGLESFFKSVDGGLTWGNNLVNDTRNFNRFYRVNNKLAYISGSRIYRHAFNPPPSIPIDPIEQHSIKVNPNPISGTSTVEVSFLNATFASLSLYSADGRKLKTLLHRRVDAGRQTLPLDLSRYPKNTYFLVLRTNEAFIDLKVVKL